MTSALPAGYTLRTPSDDDVPVLLALAEACQTREYGSPDPALIEGIVLTRRNPRFDAARDAWLVEAQDGLLVGYVHISAPDPPRLHAHVFVHSDREGQGIGTYLALLVEARASERRAASESTGPSVLHQWIAAPNAAGHALMELRGYRLVRHMWGMRIDLVDAPEVPTWPTGISARVCAGEDDLRRAFAVVNEAVRDHWGHEEQSFEQFSANMIAIPQFDPTLWFLAVEGDDIAGVTLSEMLSDRVWVSDLGVRRPWRRCGLGSALLRHACGEFYRRGARMAALGVDATSQTGATRLYEQAGMHVDRQYDVFERSL